MSELSRIVTHYLETIVRKAELRGFDELRAEVESAAEADDKEIAGLKRRVRELEARGLTLRGEA